MLIPFLRPYADFDGLLHEACREHDGIYNARLGGRHFLILSTPSAALAGRGASQLDWNCCDG
jgi:hypothetical protein